VASWLAGTRLPPAEEDETTRSEIAQPQGNKAVATEILASVRNGACPPGPNPFAGLLQPLRSPFSAQGGGLLDTLLPLGAELDPVAVERLRYGGPAPLEV
jgi:hypothetical protein